jgi:hypothetical protein
MNKKIWFILLISIISLPLVIAQEDSSCKTRDIIKAERLNARYKHYYWRAEIRRIGMDAVIDYVGEGDDADALTSIKDEFTALYDSAKSAADAGDVTEYNGVVQQGKEKIKEFKDKSHEIILEEDRADARQAVNDALEDEDNKEYIEGLKQDAIDSKKEHMLALFDSRICVVQNHLDRLEENRGIDVSSLEETLNSIADKKSELETLIDEDDREGFGDLMQELNDLFKSLREDIKNAIRNQVFSKHLERLESFINRQQGRIDNAGEGLDTSDIQTDLDEINDLISQANDEFENGNYEESREKMEEIRTALQNFAQNMKEKAEIIRADRVQKAGRGGEE